MFAVESYAAVRRFVFVEGNSQREAATVWRQNPNEVWGFYFFILGSVKLCC